jgi:hypothetical protein
MSLSSYYLRLKQLIWKKSVFLKVFIKYENNNKQNIGILVNKLNDWLKYFMANWIDTV